MRLDRGRSSMSSGRISVQKSSTSLDFETKRWPPMSKWKPLYLAVREMPPTYSGSASRTVTGTFFFERRYAAVSPAGPAPMIATFVWVSMSAGGTSEEKALGQGDAQK